MPNPYTPTPRRRLRIRAIFGPIWAEWLAGLSWIYPEICQLCFSQRASSASGFVCARCQASAAWIPQYSASKTPQTGPLESRCSFVQSALWNHGAPRAALKAYKYHGARHFEPYLHQLVGEWLERLDLQGHWDGIIPVPISRRRELQRGFNQSKEIAKEVSAGLCIPLRDRTLRRTHTRPQAGLSRSERAKNLDQALFLRSRSGPVRGRSFLIFDDVVTTGATIEACAAALIQAGAHRVAGLTLLKER